MEAVSNRYGQLSAGAEARKPRVNQYLLHTEVPDLD